MEGKENISAVREGREEKEFRREGMRNANEIIIPKIEAIYLCCPQTSACEEMEIREFYAGWNPK